MSWSEHGRRPAKGKRRGNRFKKAKDRRSEIERRHAAQRMEAAALAQKAREAAETAVSALHFQQARAAQRAERWKYSSW